MWRFALGSAVVLGLVLLPEFQKASTQTPLCSDDASLIESARRLILEGLDEALKEHTKHIFRTWLSTGVEGRENAARGIRREIGGYFYAQSVINSWRIPPCTEGAPRPPAPQR